MVEMSAREDVHKINLSCIETCLCFYMGQENSSLKHTDQLETSDEKNNLLGRG